MNRNKQKIYLVEKDFGKQLWRQIKLNEDEDKLL